MSYFNRLLVIIITLFYSFSSFVFAGSVLSANGSLSTPTDGSLADEPIKPLFSNKGLNKNKVLLGELLFFDKRLSRDNSISCATCHNFNLGGADAKPFAVGIDGQQGNINSPTVFNSSYNLAQFWDGRAQTLEEQALGPVENPIEMGTNWPEVVEKLSRDKRLKEDFKRIYNRDISAQTVTNAIAEYERSLVTMNSPFDQYLLGDPNAISTQAKQGYKLFKSYGCISCHQGSNVGSNMFHKLGALRAYFPEAEGTVLKRDLGRFNITGDPVDKHVFKVPSLRLATETAPYFHDGSIKTLREAIKTMGLYQLLREIPEKDIGLIIVFLKTLVGNYQHIGQLGYIKSEK